MTTQHFTLPRRSLSLPARAGILAGLIVITAALGGCSVTRYGEVKAKASDVESELKSEQRRVVAMPASAEDKDARLDHLTGLRGMLSAANIGLSATRYAIPEDKRDLAYDVLEEAYGTIEWNIPLGPSEPKRAMPARFNNGALRLD